MIFLTATTESLTLVTAAALSLDWSTGYVDIDTTTGATPGSDQGNVATATTTTVVAAPGASVQRQLKSFTAVNKDAALTQTVTLNKVTGAGTFALARNVALAPNETLLWVDSIGFVVLDANGVHKVANTLVNLSTGVTGTLPAEFGGTGIASYTVGDILYASGVTALSALPDVATGNALISGGVGAAPAWGKIALTTHVSGTLPVANGGTGITSLGTGVATWLGTPSSANLRSAVTDETGTGALVFADTPTLVTPVLGAATGTSVVLSSTATASAFIPTGSAIPANGMYLAAANTLTLATASAERVRVDSSGNVGIGTTPASTVVLDLKEPDAATDLIIGLSAGTGARAQIRSIAQAGSTTSELALLTTSGGVTAERVRIGAAGDVGVNCTPVATVPLRVQAAGSNDAGFEVQRTGSAEITLLSYNRAASSFADTKMVTNAWSVATGGNVERMRIDSSGNPIFTLTATPPTLSTNSNVTFNLTSNTNFRISARGSDGTTRVANITLA